MDYKFDTKEKYIGFFEKLARYCDMVAILKEDNTPNEYIDCIMKCKSEVKWMRQFPGYGEFRGKAKAEVLFYPLNKKVISVFKEYDSFLAIGCNSGIELGYMAFYKGDDVVFNVIRHEDMSYLKPEHEQYFEETIQQYRIESMYP